MASEGLTEGRELLLFLTLDPAVVSGLVVLEESALVELVCDYSIYLSLDQFLGYVVTLLGTHPDVVLLCHFLWVVGFQHFLVFSPEFGFDLDVKDAIVLVQVMLVLGLLRVL